MNLKKICRGCFREKPKAGGTCPYCGFDEIKYEWERDPEVLPLNTVLQGKYVIGKCLGRGGFGITYMGWHETLQTVIAIKEFFPTGIVSRDTGRPDHAAHSEITMVNTGSTKAYRKSLDSFIKEARTLGGLRLPGVVLVHDFFEENRTAYIVMDYVAGENLSVWLKHSGGRLSEAQVLKLIRPLTGSLQKLHEKGIIHRDISPDNLILQPDGSIMLVDFGAARTVMLEQGAESVAQSMTVVLKPGYAPMEQYSSHGRQGTWTDVYAFCATVFRMLTGAAPADPGTRADMDNDEEILRNSLESAGVSQGTIDALMKGMQLRPKNRYQSMRELEEALYGAEENRTETPDGGIGAQQPQAGKGTPEKKAVKTDGNTDGSSKGGTVSHTTQTGGQENSEITGGGGFSHSSGPSGKKMNRGLITAVLTGAFILLILAATVIGITVHSRNSKRQEVTEKVSEAETQKVSEKIAVTEPPETEASYLLTVKSGKILGTEDSTVSFQEGERITVEPEEKEHYTFTGWTVSDDNVIRQSDGENLIFAMPAKDFTVAAEYEKVPEKVTETEPRKETEASYLLTVKNGKISGTVDSTGRFHEGDRITIEPEKRERYTFTGWTVSDDNVIRQSDGEKLTFAMPAKDFVVIAEYEESTYTLTVENGTGTGEYHAGDIVTVKADEKEGYDFSYWKADRGDTNMEDASSPETTVVMGAADIKIEAVYTEKEYTVTINGGSIVGGNNGWKYKPGTSITIKANVAGGYSFSSWKVETGNITLADPSAEQTTFVMGNEDVEVTAAVEAVIVETGNVNSWIDLSRFIGASFDEIIESIPDLKMVESSSKKEKWENGTISITGTDHNNIVRIRMDSYSDKYGIYDLVPGISPEDANKKLGGYGFIYQGSSEDGWEVYNLDDEYYVAYKLDEKGLVRCIYIAKDGYLPIAIDN